MLYRSDLHRQIQLLLTVLLAFNPVAYWPVQPAQPLVTNALPQPGVDLGLLEVEPFADDICGESFSTRQGIQTVQKKLEELISR